VYYIFTYADIYFPRFYCCLKLSLVEASHWSLGCLRNKAFANAAAARVGWPSFVAVRLTTRIGL